MPMSRSSIAELDENETRPLKVKSEHRQRPSDAPAAADYSIFSIIRMDSLACGRVHVGIGIDSSGQRAVLRPARQKL